MVGRVAATPRSTWVENEIYQYNHPFASQLPQELATKMHLMAASPFAFYRGTAHIFYRDMQILPGSGFVNSSTCAIWLEGDMHLQNLGGMRDSNDNDVFDTTDFDEGYLGPYVWDLRRMAVSILLAAEENGLSSSNSLDFREDEKAQLIPVELPDLVQQQCLAISKALMLEWTAIDWRLKPTSEYVFLEANPSPMFLYFEQQTKFPITQSLVNLLLVN